MGKSDGPMAEFVALRAEIERRATLQSATTALQITATGAIYGLALTTPDLVLLLLALPFTSYLFSVRYLHLHQGALLAGQYIRVVLSPLIPGGLNWESWYWQNQNEAISRTPLLVQPSFVTFIGPPVVALIWVGYFAGAGGVDSVSAWVGAGAIWVIGVGLTVVNGRIVVRNLIQNQ